MDVPLALDEIGIRIGLKRFKSKSSMSGFQPGIVGLLVFCAACRWLLRVRPRH